MGLLDSFRSFTDNRRAEKKFFEQTLEVERVKATKAAKIIREKSLVSKAREQARFEALPLSERIGTRIQTAGTRLKRGALFAQGVGVSTAKGMKKVKGAAFKTRGGIARVSQGIESAGRGFDKRARRFDASPKRKDPLALGGSLGQSIFDR